MTPPPTHACLKSYTSWLVYRQIYQVYVQYMFTYILQFVSRRAHIYFFLFTAWRLSSEAGCSNKQQSMYATMLHFLDIDKESNL